MTPEHQTGDTQTGLQPITEDDGFIEAALRDANIPALMMSIVHLTGDASLLDGDIRPQVTATMDLQGGLAPAARERVQAIALDAIKAYRDGKAPPLRNVTPETLRKMADFVAGANVPEEYLPMMYEEMRLDEQYTRALPWPADVSQAARDAYRVLVVGAGMSGILAAIKMDEIGINYTIIEKNPNVGGTWLENTYPGCRVDVPNHFFSYSFERNPNWSHYYSKQEELRDYFTEIADRYKIARNIQFQSEVQEMRWIADEAKWHVDVRRSDGSVETLVANSVISAVGQLNRPKRPEIPGRDSFAGATSHTCGFDRDIPIDGKRVAVIGTGASALQMVPELAKRAAKIDLYQRTPTWVLPTATYHETVPEGMKWLLGHLPFYANWYRFLLFWGLTDGHWDWFKIDPAWPDKSRSVSAVNDGHRQTFTDFIKQQIGDRPELLEKVIPGYPPFTKRMLLDNGNYLRTLVRDNVEVISTKIRSIDESGVNTADGIHRDADVIVYATGFHSNRFLFPMRVVGRDGVVLSDYWGDEGRAYLGMTVPNFPNFFIIWGPGTSVGAGGSMIFISECNVRYILSAIQQMIAQDIPAVEVREHLYHDYALRSEKELDTLVWSSQGVNSWYKNASGKVVSTLPWRLVDYWNWTKSFNLSDFTIEKPPVGEQSREPA